MLIYSKFHINIIAIIISIIIFSITSIFLVKFFNQKNIPKKENEIQLELSDNYTDIPILCNFYQSNKWRIVIPKIKVDAPIEDGTGREVLRRCVGHFETSDKWQGNVVLAAHNRGYKCNFFQDIKSLEKGDEIIYKTENGERKYVVEDSKIIEETDFRDVNNTENNRLTLLTCIENMRTYRRCVIAVEKV